MLEFVLRQEVDGVTHWFPYALLAGALLIPVYAWLRFVRMPRRGGLSR